MRGGGGGGECAVMEGNRLALGAPCTPCLFRFLIQPCFRAIVCAFVSVWCASVSSIVVCVSF